MTKHAPAAKPSADQIRREIAAHMGMPVSVWSINGRDVGFQCSFDQGLQVGGFAGVATPDGEHLVVQVLELSISERESMRIAVDTEFLGEAAASALESANVNLVVRFVVGTARVLTAVADGALVRPSGQGFREGTIEPVAESLVAELLRRELGSSVGLPIGTLHGMSVDAELKASGFSRHTFMVGQSGSGKTYSLGAMLERLYARTSLPMVIIDPNSDHVHLGTVRKREQIARRGKPPISRQAYAELKADLQAAGDVVVARADSKDHRLAIHLSDLAIHEQALTVDLDPLRDAGEYAAFIEAVEALHGLQFYGFHEVVEQLAQQDSDAASRLLRRISNLRVAEWEVWARPGEPSLVGRQIGVRVLVLDTGSLEDSRARSVVALAVLGSLRRRVERNPILVVIDEAHNVLSPELSSALEREIVDYGVWVAGEGRKYGIHMVISTQRPQKIHRNVISQCDNLVLMRMNSVLDIEELAATFSHVPKAMIAEARSFVQGEMVVAGPIATPPMRVDVGERWCPEGGADLPTTWAARRT